MLVTVALVVAGAGLALAARLARPSAAPITGIVVDQPVPAVQLVGADGRASSLAVFAGRVVVLAPFLTLCHDVCPITTGAFLAMERDVDAAGLADRVAFVEVTIDPGRDTPARLRAYARLTGANWPLLTGSASAIASFWRFFGVYYERAPEPSPAAVDWWTNQPEAYDVVHTNGLFFIGPHGRERALIQGGPNLDATLPPALTGLLDAQGRQALTHPQGAWTVRQALDDLGLLLGRHIPG